VDERSMSTGWEDAALLQLAGQDQFHVAGTLELLIDHIIQAGTCVHQAGGDE